MHIAALTLTPASTLSHGFRHTVLVVPLSTAPLAAFLLRLAMGGVPVVTRLVQCCHLHLHTDVILISDGLRPRSDQCLPILRFSMGGDLIPLTYNKTQA